MSVSRRGLTRRRVVALALWGPLAAACAPSPPGVAPVPTKPPEATRPPVSGGEASKPTAEPKPAAAQPAPATGGQPTPGPGGLVVQAVAALEKPKSSARLTDSLQVLQNQDFHPEQNAFVRLLLQEWGKAQGWPVVVTPTTAVQGNFNERLQALVQAGTPPDLLDHNLDHRQQALLGVLAPVSDLVRELEGLHGRANPGFVNAANFDGQWWGVPYYERAGGWYVRLDWFREAGLDPARELETLTQAREAALKISDPPRGRWGWGLTANRSGDGESVVRLIGYAHGARIQDKDGLRPTIDTPEWVAAFDFVRETYSDPRWAKVLPPGLNTWNDISNNEAFLAGTIGITDNAGTMLAKALYDGVPFAKDIGFVTRPRADLGKGPVPQSGGGETIRLLKGAKNKDAAFDTVRFWLSKEAQRTIWTISPAYALPAYANGWDDPVVKDNANSAAYRVIASNRLWDGDYTPGPRTAAMGALLAGNLFTDMAAQAVRAGTSSKQNVQEGQQRAVKVFQEFGLKGD